MDTSAEFKDLTQQLQQVEREKEKLQELNEKKDRLFSTIAHDLRSPFQSLLGISEILSSEAGSMSVEEIIKFSTILNSAIRNQYELLNHILDWARLQSNKIDFNPKQLDLYEIICKVLKIFLPLAVNKNIELISEINKDTKVMADEDMIMVILQNLISNAIKFSYRGNNIKVTFNSSEGEHRITIIDNGVGLTREAIEKIFKFDSKYSALGTEGEAGSGIGLMIIYEMLKRHKGKLVVESEINKGSKFTLILPVVCCTSAD
jgi:two-component system sensor histidine kinase/response regulator